MAVGRKNHNPSIARRILRDLKRGESPENLIPLAKGITDSYYTALGLTYIVSIGLGKMFTIHKSVFVDPKVVYDSAAKTTNLQLGVGLKF